jgi:hypothetical protein
MVKKVLYVASLSLAFAACTPAPKEAYFNRADPESLLELSTEAVNARLTSPASVQEIIDTINKQQPTRAEVRCPETDGLCREAMHVMKQFAVPVKYSNSGANTVTLIYERVLTHNCQNRFIDNTAGMGNLNNLNYPTLGCSVAINMVQMVSDKRQFTNPELMSTPAATKPVQVMTNYDAVHTPDTSFPTMVESGSSGTTSR